MSADCSHPVLQNDGDGPYCAMCGDPIRRSDAFGGADT